MNRAKDTGQTKKRRSQMLTRESKMQTKQTLDSTILLTGFEETKFKCWKLLGKTTIYRNTRILEKELFWKKWFPWVFFSKKRGLDPKIPWFLLKWQKFWGKKVCVENIFVKTLILNKRNLTKELIKRKSFHGFYS